MKKLIWLPAWYPNKIQPFAGDFIQRHAKAASLFHAVQVIHVLRDKKGILTKDVLEENFMEGNLAEKIIYYHTPVFPVPFIDKIISNKRYGSLYRKALKSCIDIQAQPYCSHVHVTEKNALLALWLKKKYKIPFVISEHWTLYLPDAIPRFDDLSIFFRAMWKRVMREASGLTTVSRYLGEAIGLLANKIPYTVVPNVVDERIFYPVFRKTDTVKKFIHISGLDYQKNPRHMLEAFAGVKKVTADFTLNVFGPPQKALQEMVVTLGLEKQVQFFDELPQPLLAGFVQAADALILYSRYETFGCVLIEANACGVPVIVSDLPVFHEIIQEGVNGYFVPGENPDALAQKIIQFIQKDGSPDRAAIAFAAKEKYNYTRVGELFNRFYSAVLPH